MMALEILELIILITNLVLLGAPRFNELIKVVGVQGFLVSIVPIISSHVSTSGVVFGLVTATIKGLVIPYLLFYTLKSVKIKSEARPIIGYNISVILGMLIMVVTFYLCHRFGLKILVTVAAITFFCGLSLMVIRRKALAQVVGYLVMENGIYLFGAIFVHQIPYILEFGILLDLLVAVMIMGIVLYNINETFDDIDTSLLTQLKDKWND